MTKKVKEFLDRNNLSETDFEYIMSKVTKENKNLKIMMTQYPMGWKYCNIKLLERILEIYNESQVDINTGNIITANFD